MRIRHVQPEHGASSVEYALLASAIAAVIVLIVYGLGTVTQGQYQRVCDNVQAAQPGSCP